MIEILLGIVIILLIANLWLTLRHSARRDTKTLQEIKSSIGIFDNSLLGWKKGVLTSMVLIQQNIA